MKKSLLLMLEKKLKNNMNKIRKKSTKIKSKMIKIYIIFSRNQFSKILVTNNNKKIIK